MHRSPPSRDRAPREPVPGAALAPDGTVDARGDVPSDLRDRADRLAEQGRWAELHEALDAVGEEGVLAAGRALAYRYGEALFHTGRMEELSVWADRCEEAARRDSDVGGILRALNLAGIAAFELGEVDRARERFEKLMELAEAESSNDMMARAANGLGSIAVLAGRHDEALSIFQLAEPLYARLDNVRGLAQLYHNHGICFRDLGRYDDALDAYLRASRLADDIGYDFLAGMTAAGRAEIELIREDTEYAQRLARRALETVREVGDPISEAEALRVLALAEAQAGGSRAEIVGYFESGLELARETRSTLLEAEIERDLGSFLVGEGSPEEGRERLERAVEIFRRVGAAGYAEEARETLAALGG